MSKTDFQNGFVTGMLTKGKVTQKDKLIEVSSTVAQVILPITVPTVTVEINNKNIQTVSSVNLEE